MDAPTSDKPRLVFVANTMYSNIMSGGEVHTANLAACAVAAGYQVHFFTGHAFKAEIERRQLPVSVSLTDSSVMRSRDFSVLGGQLALFADYFRRLRGSLQRLHEIQARDVVYCATEFWWDAVPALRSRAARKVMF